MDGKDKMQISQSSTFDGNNYSKGGGVPRWGTDFRKGVRNSCQWLTAKLLRQTTSVTTWTFKKPNFSALYTSFHPVSSTKKIALGCLPF